ERRTHRLDRLRFADRDQGHRVRRASGRPRRRGNAIPHLAQISADSLHNGTPSLSIAFLAQASTRRGYRLRRQEQAAMPTPYYRSLLIFAATVSLITTGCGSSNPSAAVDPVTGSAPKLAANSQRNVNTNPNEMDTETNIF